MPSSVYATRHEGSRGAELIPEIAWDIVRVEAQAMKWKEMDSVLANDYDRVAWLIEQISYLSASHLQLQQVCRVHSDAVVNAHNRADGIEQV